MQLANGASGAVCSMQRRQLGGKLRQLLQPGVDVGRSQFGELSRQELLERTSACTAGFPPGPRREFRAA